MILEAFKTAVANHFSKAQPFLIGLSGGRDSVALLHLFAQTDYPIRAIHIHHGLSPNADHWLSFCQALCQAWQIPFIAEKVKLPCANNLEANAREARYQAISKHLKTNEVLATAHHLDDQAETFLLALKRGAGVKGLSAMQAVSFKRNFAHFRPLLNISRAEITTYAQSQQLNWIEDESNLNTEFDRNFLRQTILPELNQRWQQFNQMVARSAELCASQQQLLEELLSDELTKRIDLKRQSLAIDDFSHFSTAKQQQLIRLWLEKCGEPMPSLVQLNQILQKLILAQTDKNPEIKLGEKWLRRYQQQLFLCEPQSPVAPFEAELLPNMTLTLPAQLGKIEFDGQTLFYKTAEKTDRFPLPQSLHHQPLKVKLQQQGKVKCVGKAHREEMKKIWQQHQVPVWLRPLTPLIFSGEELLFVLN